MSTPDAGKVFQKRIHNMKVVEQNYKPLAEWMEWEKQYFTCYHELQLMNTRPCLALGMIGLVAMSVPASRDGTYTP
ncbi:hypothetical protein LguiB_019264 [Lonicera macranthoides]